MEQYKRKYRNNYYQHKKQFTLDNSNRLVLREHSQPDKSVMFAIHTVSKGEERLAEIASKADTVIYCGGNDPEQVARECYDRKTIELPTVQRKAVMKLSETRLDFVFVIVSSYTYAMPFTANRPSAILWTSHAGPELGHALTETVFGEKDEYMLQFIKNPVRGIKNRIHDFLRFSGKSLRAMPVDFSAFFSKAVILRYTTDFCTAGYYSTGKTVLFSG